MTSLYYTKITSKFQKLYYNDYLEKLPDFLKKRIGGYFYSDAKQASLLGFLLLNECIGPDSLDNLYYDKFGKPHLDTIFFNISHSYDYVVCAVSNQYQVGVDIEKVKDVQIENFKFHLTPEEWNAIIYSKDSATAFLDCWTRKEAVVKGDGRGLQIKLNSFEINENQTVINKIKWFVYDFNNLIPNYRIHMALHHNIPKHAIQTKYIDFENQ